MGSATIYFHSTKLGLALFDLGFFVHNVLPDYGIKFL
ncbi:MAG: hypothetical protein ACI9OF_002994, partial [Saprospiraceae bacterium]